MFAMQDRERLRKGVIELILATDMKHHCEATACWLCTSLPQPTVSQVGMFQLSISMFGMSFLCVVPDEQQACQGIAHLCFEASYIQTQACCVLCVCCMLRRCTHLAICHGA